MTFKQTALTYEMNALEPHISKETLEFHYGKHHKTYITKLNALIENTDYANQSLVDIIRSSKGSIFNNAAQHWNHAFYWSCLTPNSPETPTGELAQKIDETFGNFDQFRQEFTASALGNFGSGWTWLVKNSDNTLAIVNTSNAATPLTENQAPLLTCDVWEHAYYIDYRNARPNYLNGFWQLVNWHFVADNYTSSLQN